MKKLLIIFILFVFFINLSNIVAQIKINEIVASNYKLFYDEDYKSSDWIELCNYSNQTINLKGWKISDKNDFSEAWTFPDTVINPKSYLVLFASDKNRTSSGNLIIEAAGFGYATWTAWDAFRYIYVKVDGNFDFSCKVHSIRNTKLFGCAGIALRENLTEDSRYVALLNQTRERGGYSLLLRDTLRTYPILINTRYQNISPNRFLKMTRKDDTITASIMTPDSFCLEEKKIYFHSKQNVYIGIAFTSSNRGVLGKVAVSDIVLNNKMISYNKLNVIEFNTIINGKNYLSNELHTNFKLKKEGETVYLWNQNQVLVDSLAYPSLKSNISYGIAGGNPNNKFYFEIPTPDSENVNPFVGISETPIISEMSGSYSTPLNVVIQHNDNKARIFYTLNGDRPDSIKAYQYIGEPIYIDKTTILKAISYSQNNIPSNIVSRTYLMNEDLALSVFSISADSLDLWGEKNGLLVEKNKFVAKGVQTYFDFFDKNLDLKYSSACEMKIHENGAEGYTHKSMRLYARGGLGNSKFQYHFFGNNYNDVFDKLLIRSAGQDWWEGFIRDALFSVLAKDFTTINGTEYKPVEVFFNNRYWGMYNLRERVDEEYILEKYNLDDINKVNLIEDDLYCNYGTSKDFFVAYDSIVHTKNPEIKFNIANRHFDIANFTDYFIIEFYSGNWDWFGHNQKFWSSTEYDGKWRWILNDLDWSIAYGSATRPNNKMVDRAYKLFQEKQEDVKVTSILFNLFEYQGFRNNFLNRCADVLNSKLSSNHVKHIVDSLAEQIHIAIKHQQKRWSKSCPNWGNSIKDIINYADLRPDFLREQFVNHFQLSGTSVVLLKSSPIEGGSIKINSSNINKFPWSGIYFQDVPVKIQAIPNKGYKFIAWSDSSLKNDTATILLPDSINLTAYFIKDDTQDTNIVINEIMYKCCSDKNSKDWIELFNCNDKDIDISKWLLKDDNENHKFIFPLNTKLKSQEYLVICKDIDDFKEVYPQIKNCIGNIGFGFGKDDEVQLLNSKGITVDKVKYYSTAPWPQNSYGTGNSIELINPIYDNSIAENWQSSFELHGTPGRQNSVFTNVSYTTENNNITLSNYPNPFSEITSITFYLSENSIISLNIYNYLGNKICNLVNNKRYNKGKHIINYQSENLPKGMYYCQMTVNGKLKNINVMIIE